MGDTINFDYYYGIEAEQFSFYRVPRLLIKDERFKGLSSDAKLLYGLMLDRMSLSMKNGWLDDENRASVCLTIWKRSVDWGIVYEIIRVSFRSNFFIDMYAGVGTPTVWPALAN